MSEEEAARVLGMYFRAESVPKILDERIPGFGGRTVREIAQHEPDRFHELLERFSSFVPPPDAAGMQEIRNPPVVVPFEIEAPPARATV